MTPHQIHEAKRLGRRGVSDATIGAGVVPPITRQAVHVALGPRARTPRTKPAATPEAPTIAEFASLLRAWRARRGLSPSSAARTLRVTTHTIAVWEQRRTGCSLAASMILLMESLDRLDNTVA